MMKLSENWILRISPAIRVCQLQLCSRLETVTGRIKKKKLFGRLKTLNNATTTTTTSDWHTQEKIQLLMRANVRLEDPEDLEAPQFLEIGDTWSPITTEESH
jgi:hypothetical protein